MPDVCGEEWNTGNLQARMNLSTLLQIVGEENVQIQRLNECMVGAQHTRRGTHITFGTQAVSALELLTNSERNVGIIVWIPKEKWPA